MYFFGVQITIIKIHDGQSLLSCCKLHPEIFTVVSINDLSSKCWVVSVLKMKLTCSFHHRKFFMTAKQVLASTIC